MDEIIKGAITREELASIYGICTKTLQKWLKEKNIKLPKGLIKPEDQKNIYSQLGFPTIPKNSKLLQKSLKKSFED